MEKFSAVGYVGTLAAVLVFGASIFGCSRNSNERFGDVSDYLSRAQKEELVDVLSADSLRTYLDAGLRFQRIDNFVGIHADSSFGGEVDLRPYNIAIQRAYDKKTISSSELREFNSKLAQLALDGANGILRSRPERTLPLFEIAWDAAKKTGDPMMFYREIDLGICNAINHIHGNGGLTANKGIGPIESKSSGLVVGGLYYFEEIMEAEATEMGLIEPVKIDSILQSLKE